MRLEELDELIKLLNKYIEVYGSATAKALLTQLERKVRAKIRTLIL